MNQSLLNVDGQLYGFLIRLRRLFPIFKAIRIFRVEGLAGVKERLQHRLRGASPWWENRAWVKKYTPNQEQLAQMAHTLDTFEYKPVISVVVPVYNPEKEFLEDAIESVRAQVYPHWELCIADDASTRTFVKEVVHKYSELDQRIKFVVRAENGHISEASNSALELATGEYVALLDHDDRLAPHALFSVVKALNEDPSIDVVYSNEDKIDFKGFRTEPAFKASWSPEYFLSFMYVGHLGVYRRALIEKAGRFRKGFEGSQDYDLALRIFELTNNVVHVPEILYHWRKHPESVAVNIMAKPYAFTSGKKALEESCQRQGLANIKVEDTEAPGIYRMTPNNLALTPQVVYIGGKCPEWATELPNCSWQELFSADPGSFSDTIVFANSSVSIDSTADLESLFAIVAMEGVGMVAAKVTDTKNRVVEAGYTVEAGQVKRNFYGYPDRHPGYGARLFSTYNVSALTLLCAACKSSALVESGFLKWGAQLDGVVRDVALSFALRAKGYRLVWSPRPHLSYTGPALVERVDLRVDPQFPVLNERFGLGTYRDPYYPQGLDRKRLDFTVEM